jgi:hypothetical protein
VLAVLIAGAPLLPHLRFDFDPLHLKDPDSESMSTLLALKDAPQAGTDNVSVLAPSVAAAQQIATRLKTLPEVERVVTLKTFIPDDQPAKLAIVAGMAKSLMPVLTQTRSQPAEDVRRVASLRNASRQLALAAEDHPGRARLQPTICRKRSRSWPMRRPPRATARNRPLRCRCNWHWPRCRTRCSPSRSRSRRCRPNWSATGSRPMVRHWSASARSCPARREER